MLYFMFLNENELFLNQLIGMFYLCQFVRNLSLSNLSQDFVELVVLILLHKPGSSSRPHDAP